LLVLCIYVISSNLTLFA